MIRRVAALAVLATLALAGTAQAVTLANPDGTPVGGQWQQWVDEMKVPTYDGNVTLLLVDQATAATTCGGNPACAIWPADQIVLDPYNRTREGLYHELGHIYDFTMLTDAQREWFTAIWHIAPYSPETWAAWTPIGLGQNRSEYAPREWFAEGYRLCALGAHPGAQSGYDYKANYAARTTAGPRGFPLNTTRRERHRAETRQRAVCRLIRAS